MNSQAKKKQKVFVGLSGGVDSSVSAALLKSQGYDVTGVFIKVWQPHFAEASRGAAECTWREDRLDAMRVCAKLEIPFVTLDLSKEYKMEVVDYMVAEYKAGRTPNPDVMCNRYVKFGGFFKWAMAQGADYVATGHYARSARVESLKFKVESKKHKSQNLNLKSDNNWQLLAGVDANKDQSYFLWTLTQKQLAHTLFPVGDMEKLEVRKLAKKFGLPTADKKDSQGLCFIGKIDVKDFLKSFIKPKRGNVLNEKGEIIGEHRGAAFLTIGERHSFTVRTVKTRTDAEQTQTDADKNQRPYYVVAKDIDKNTITVSHKSPEGILANAVTEVPIKDCNWISGEVPALDKIYYARCRYRQPLQKVRITNYELRIMNKTKSQKGDSSIIPAFAQKLRTGKHNFHPNVQKSARYGQAKFIIRFVSAQSSVTPGQSIVIYDGDVCLGGGIIE